MKRCLLAIVLLPAVLSAQNVGLGTINPLMKLHVSTADSAVALLENTLPLGLNASNALYFKTGNSTYAYTGAVKTIGEGTNMARLGLFTYSAPAVNGLRERLSITDGGLVGIGTSVPQTMLHLNPNGAGALLIGSNRSSGGYTNLEMGISAQTNGYAYLQATKASGTTYGNLILNANGGNVGIGTSAPAASLDIRGGIALPVKTVSASYICQPDDYTIVVDMKNSLSYNIDITLPGQYTNTGRIIKVVAINLANAGGTIDEGISSFGAVHIFSGLTQVHSLYLYTLSDRHNNGSGMSTNMQQRVANFAVTLQCTGTAAGWIVTDKIAEYNYYEDHYDTL